MGNCPHIVSRLCGVRLQGDAKPYRGESYYAKTTSSGLLCFSSTSVGGENRGGTGVRSGTGLLGRTGSPSTPSISGAACHTFVAVIIVNLAVVVQEGMYLVENVSILLVAGRARLRQEGHVTSVSDQN
jgi:hypothetical protein